MPKATTSGGVLEVIPNCYIEVPGYSGRIDMKSLPDISDSKSASYNDEVIIGRTEPIKTYSHSASRTISWQVHLYVTSPKDITANLEIMRALESAVYSREAGSGAVFLPPVICKLQCGELLSKQSICAILLNYSVKFPTDTSWADGPLTPFKFDVDLTFEVVHSSTSLPGQDRIIKFGD